MRRLRMVLDEKKMPKDLHDWLVEEALEFHEGNEEIMKKVKGSKPAAT